MEPCADMDCCLKVHPKCESCMMKTVEVLRSIRGVYSVVWDAQQNLFKISGEVDPNILLKAVLRTGEHAELVTVKLKHPQLRHNNYNYGSYGSTAGYHPPSYGYRDGYRSSANYYDQYNNPYSLPHHGSSAIEYPSSYSTTYDYQHALPQATHVPSYPHQEYNDPYENYEGISFCTIM